MIRRIARWASRIGRLRGVVGLMSLAGAFTLAATAIVITSDDPAATFVATLAIVLNWPPIVALIAILFGVGFRAQIGELLQSFVDREVHGRGPGFEFGAGARQPIPPDATEETPATEPPDLHLLAIWKQRQLRRSSRRH